MYFFQQGRILGIRCVSQASERRRYGPTDGPTDGRTDGQTLLQRCVDASKNPGQVDAVNLSCWFIREMMKENNSRLLQTEPTYPVWEQSQLNRFQPSVHLPSCMHLPEVHWAGIA